MIFENETRVRQAIYGRPKSIEQHLMSIKNYGEDAAGDRGDGFLSTMILDGRCVLCSFFLESTN